MAPAGTKICLVGVAGSDPEVIEAAKGFGVEVLTSEDGSEWKGTASKSIIFVLDSFEGTIESDTLPRDCLLGVTALKELAGRKQPLPHLRRPLFTLSMFRLIICFTGFRRKEELRRLINLIHQMGGSIRKDMDSDVTHLVAQRCGGDKYTYAMTFRVPVMAASWVHEAWAMRAQPGHDANDPENIAAHRLKPFQGLRVCFLGFPENEQKDMAEILAQNGGTHTDHEDPQCSHMVLDSAVTYDLVKSGAWVAHDSPPPSPTLTPSLAAIPTPAPSPPLPLPTSTPMDISPDHPFHRELSRSRHSIARNSSDAVGKRLSLTPLASPALLESPVSLARTQTLEPIQESSPVTVLAEVRIKKELSFSDHDESTVSPRAFGAKRRKTMSPTELAQTRRAKRSPRDGFKKFAHSTLRKSFKLKTHSLARWISSSDVCARQSPAKRTVSSSPPPVHALLPSGAGTEQEESRMPMVVDESMVSQMPEKTPSHAAIVKAEWFWASVQNEACVDEKDYLFEDNPPPVDLSVGSQFLDSLVSPRHATPATAGTRARKRKRLREAVAQLAAASSPANNKRRSSVSDAGLLSMSGSFLDCTNSPSAVLSEGEVESVSGDTPLKNLSSRHQVFKELVQTESNYVKILETIINLYKTPLEQMCESGNPLLKPMEVKNIFGHLPPIYETHRQMLEQLRAADSRWTEDIVVGKIITDFSAQLEKAYPPYINYYEETRTLLNECDRTNGRFHAFLMIGRSKPESCKQPLVDLLIRPVQRLPSMILLLEDILKHTAKNNPDYGELQKAVEAIKGVTMHINEEKRHTDGFFEILKIPQTIEGLEADLVSSHRSLIARCETTQQCDGLSRRGHSLIFFLFSDILEICKIKKNSEDKPYKHVKKMSISEIKSVIDIRETEKCRNEFALMCKSNEELKERLYRFTFVRFIDGNEKATKRTLLEMICKQVASAVCRTDPGYFLNNMDPEQLDNNTSDIGSGTLSKAFKLASRTSNLVSRALSMKKTPNRLKRAVSTMSPFHGHGLGQCSRPTVPALTPATQLAQMRLASCNNLSELGSATPVAAPTYAAPLSVQPTRRNKHNSLSVASLRRL